MLSENDNAESDMTSRSLLGEIVSALVMISDTPRIASRLANVTINAGTPIHAIQNTCQSPMISPNARVITTVGTKENQKTVLA